MRIAEVQCFEIVQSQIKEMHTELSTLSKSKPDNPINVFKLRLVNEKLTTANALLNDEFKPFESFNLFDEETLPSNSDVVFVLSQYLDALESWRSVNVKYDDVELTWYWDVSGSNRIVTSRPSRMRKR